MSLDRFQKKFIRNQIKEIGNIKQIEKLYDKDDEVSKYALELLRKAGFKETKAKVYFRIKEYKEVANDSPEVFVDYLEAVRICNTNLEENPKKFFKIVRCRKNGK